MIDPSERGEIGMEVTRVERLLVTASIHIENTLSKTPKASRDDLKNLHLVLRETKEHMATALKKASKMPLSDKVVQRILKAMAMLQQDAAAQVKVGTVETALFYETVRDLQHLLLALQEMESGYKKVAKVSKTSSTKKKSS